MKKLLTIIIGCSLALATGAMAQQDDTTPAKKKKKQQAEQQGAAQQSQPGANQGRPNQQARPDRQARPGNEARPKQNRKAKPQEHAGDNAPVENNGAASKPNSTSNNSRETNAQGKHAAHKTAPADGTAAASTKPETSASTAAEAGSANRPGKNPTKKRDPQVVQQVKTEHANFKAQAKPEKVPAVTFNESYRISGAQQWQGQQYEVFRAYHPARHDYAWYHSHYPRIEIIAGGAYYFNNGYWFPAWGYNPSYQYYAYDAPIYAGSQALPPDRVVADVQAILQQEGYYKGEVDGLLGPLTREALTQYQADNGLYTTATIDEPTLQSLDLG